MKRILIPILVIGILLLGACAAPSAPPPTPAPAPAPVPAPSDYLNPITEEEFEKFGCGILLKVSDLGLQGFRQDYHSSDPAEGALCRRMVVIKKTHPLPSDPWEGAFLREIIDLYPNSSVAIEAFNLLKKSASLIMDSDFGIGEQCYQCKPGHTTFRRNNVIVSIVLFGEGSGKDYARLADTKILSYLTK